MEAKVMNLITKTFSGAVNLFDRLVSGVPGAETAIVWGVFVTLVTGFLIIPIRGYGASDRARAGRVIRKNRRAKSRAKAKDSDD